MCSRRGASRRRWTRAHSPSFKRSFWRTTDCTCSARSAPSASAACVSSRCDVGRAAERQCHASRSEEHRRRIAAELLDEIAHLRPQVVVFEAMSIYGTDLDLLLERPARPDEYWYRIP